MKMPSKACSTANRSQLSALRRKNGPSLKQFNLSERTIFECFSLFS
jgi:hypothetical protein